MGETTERLREIIEKESFEELILRLVGNISNLGVRDFILNKFCERNKEKILFYLPQLAMLFIRLEHDHILKIINYFSKKDQLFLFLAFDKNLYNRLRIKNQQEKPVNPRPIRLVRCNSTDFTTSEPPKSQKIGVKTFNDLNIIPLDISIEEDMTPKQMPLNATRKSTMEKIESPYCKEKHSKFVFNFGSIEAQRVRQIQSRADVTDNSDSRSPNLRATQFIDANTEIRRSKTYSGIPNTKFRPPVKPKFSLESFEDSPDFLELFIKIVSKFSLYLKIKPIHKRKHMLRIFLKKVNWMVYKRKARISYNNASNIIDMGIYMPFSYDSRENQSCLIVNILENEISCFNTKKRVPYKITLECVDTLELLDFLKKKAKKGDDLGDFFQNNEDNLRRKSLEPNEMEIINDFPMDGEFENLESIIQEIEIKKVAEKQRMAKNLKKFMLNQIEHPNSEIALSPATPSPIMSKQNISSYRKKINRSKGGHSKTINGTGSISNTKSNMGSDNRSGNMARFTDFKSRRVIGRIKPSKRIFKLGDEIQRRKRRESGPKADDQDAGQHNRALKVFKRGSFNVLLPSKKKKANRSLFGLATVNNYFFGFAKQKSNCQFLRNIGQTEAESDLNSLRAEIEILDGQKQVGQCQIIKLRQTTAFSPAQTDYFRQVFERNSETQNLPNFRENPENDSKISDYDVFLRQDQMRYYSQRFISKPMFMPTSSEQDWNSEFSPSREHSLAKKKKDVFSSRLTDLDFFERSKQNSNRSILKKKHNFVSEGLPKKRKSVCFQIDAISDKTESYHDRDSLDTTPIVEEIENYKGISGKTDSQKFSVKFRKVSLEQENESGMSVDRNPIVNSDDLINIEIEELRNLEIQEMLDSLKDSHQCRSLQLSNLAMDQNSVEKGPQEQQKCSLNFSKKNNQNEEILESPFKPYQILGQDSDQHKMFQKELLKRSSEDDSRNLSGTLEDTAKSLDSKVSCDQNIVENPDKSFDLCLKIKNPFYMRSKTMGNLSAFEKSEEQPHLLSDGGEIEETKFEFEEALRTSLEMKFKRYFRQTWQQKKKELRALSPYGGLKSYRIRQIIVKANDDLRQELIIMQLMKLFNNIFQEQQTGLILKPYDIMVTSEDSGFLEFVADSVSIDQIKKDLGPDLDKTFRKLFENKLREAQMNFVRSLAGYSIFTYLLQIKDRHNGNILLTVDGCIAHIDFGFAFTTSPGGINFERSPFKLTKEYVRILDGPDSDLYFFFKLLVSKGFLALTKEENIKRIKAVMAVCYSFSDLECFQKFSVKKFWKRFCIGLTPEQRRKHAETLINESYDSLFTNKYDDFQEWTNKIHP